VEPPIPNQVVQGEIEDGAIRLVMQPAQRAGRAQPRAVAEGRCPGKASTLKGALKGREKGGRKTSRGLSGRTANGAS
jgi:hypothetical protein